MFNMKNQALFSFKDESKKLKCRLMHFLFGALRVNSIPKYYISDEFSGHCEMQSADGSGIHGFLHLTQKVMFRNLKF